MVLSSPLLHVSSLVPSFSFPLLGGDPLAFSSDYLALVLPSLLPLNFLFPFHLAVSTGISFPNCIMSLFKNVSLLLLEILFNYSLHLSCSLN